MKRFPPPLLSAIFLIMTFTAGWAYEFVTGPLYLEGYWGAILLPGTSQSEANSYACVDASTNLGSYVSANPEPVAADDDSGNVGWNPNPGNDVTCTEGSIRVFQRNDGRYVGVKL